MPRLRMRQFREINEKSGDVRNQTIKKFKKMKSNWFHEQGNRDLPRDFSKKNDYVWITSPNTEQCDSAAVRKHLSRNIDEVKNADDIGLDEIIQGQVEGAHQVYLRGLPGQEWGGLLSDLAKSHPVYESAHVSVHELGGLHQIDGILRA